MTVEDLIRRLSALILERPEVAKWPVFTETYGDGAYYETQLVKGKTDDGFHDVMYGVEPTIVWLENKRVVLGD